MKKNLRLSLIVPIAMVSLFLPAAGQNECDNWQTDHTDWIFCDDFEDTGALVKQGRYFEYDDNAGDFVPKAGIGLSGSRGMQVRWQAGEVGAGSIKLSFGRNPNAYMNKQNIRPGQDFREIYYRMYLRMQSGWQGSPAKLSRATIFTSANDWRQAMIAHLWSDDSAHLLIDPASCIDGGVVQCTTYNDFNHLKWLGNKSGITPLFATDHSGIWYCIEAHVKLNDPGQSNGVQEFWIDGRLEARREGLNFTGTYRGLWHQCRVFRELLERGVAGSAGTVFRQHRGFHKADRMFADRRGEAGEEPWYDESRHGHNCGVQEKRQGFSRGKERLSGQVQRRFTNRQGSSSR